MKKFLIKIFKMPPAPYALEWDEWDEWEEDLKAKYPMGYFFTETIPTVFRKIFVYRLISPIQDAIYSFRCRFVKKYYLIDTKLPRSHYCDSDSRMLHGMFELLVDFIEVELATLHIIFNPKRYKQSRIAIRWNSKWRNAKLGLEYIDEYLSDPDMPDEQKAEYKIMLELYNWWKNRPNRIDPHSVTNDVNEEIRRKYGCSLLSNKWRDDEDLVKIHDIALDEMVNLEKKYLEEDTENLIKLIKIRYRMWT